MFTFVLKTYLELFQGVFNIAPKDYMVKTESIGTISKSKLQMNNNNGKVLTFAFLS